MNYEPHRKNLPCGGTQSRKAFETILDSMLKKGQTQDVGDLAEQLIDMIQKIHKGT